LLPFYPLGLCDGRWVSLRLYFYYFFLILLHDAEAEMRHPWGFDLERNRSLIDNYRGALLYPSP